MRRVGARAPHNSKVCVLPAWVSPVMARKCSRSRGLAPFPNGACPLSSAPRPFKLSIIPAKFLYDMAKGIGLIVVVGGLVGGQVNWWGVSFGLFTMSGLFCIAYWLDGERAE